MRMPLYSPIPTLSGWRLCVAFAVMCVVGPAYLLISKVRR